MKKSSLILRRFSAIFLCLAVFCTMFSFSSGAASVFARPQKHIYLVMDDSGSMIGECEFDANYALQTLIAMTDKTDTINLYFLNAKSKIDGKVDMSNKSNKLLENIKVKYPEADGSTPFSAVTDAQADIKKAVTQDDDGEYWLIVITDGGFSYPIMDYEQNLADFAKTQLKNGKYPNLLCVSINSSGMILKDENKNLPNLYTLEGSDVITSMNQAAAIISNRIEIKEENATYSNGNKTVEFNVPYPAKNIIIFTQNTKTSITSHTSASNLNTKENYNVSRPIKTSTLDTSTVCFITENSGNSIASGKVSFSFDRPINPQNTVILVEPAIGLYAQFYNQDGTACDPSELKVGETAKLVYTICDPTTKQQIDESTIDGGVKYRVNINGKDYNSNNIEFTVDSDTLTIDMFADFTDGFTLDIHEEYKDLKDLRILTLTLSDGGSFSQDINQLDGSKFITATPTYNGEKLTADEIKASNLTIKGDNPITGRFKIEKDESNGTYKITPKGGIIKLFTPIDLKVEVVFTSDRNEVITETLNVNLPGDRNVIGLIIALLCIAALIYLIVIYSIKPKFPLDLRLYSYRIVDYKSPVNIKNTLCKPKTLFHPGVIDFVSALPWKHPFRIRLSAVDPAYGNMMLIASNGSAFVQNVPTASVPNPINPMRSSEEPLYKVIDSKQNRASLRGFADKNQLTNESLNSKYGPVLIIKESEFLQEQKYSKGVPKKLLRYVRKRTQKANGEL